MRHELLKTRGVANVDIFGSYKKEAMLESIHIRTRPALMTAFAVAAGMLPVALGSAIGLERLAPLGAVAIGGLIVGTFLTLLFIPLIFIMVTKEVMAS